MKGYLDYLIDNNYDDGFEKILSLYITSEYENYSSIINKLLLLKNSYIEYINYLLEYYKLKNNLEYDNNNLKFINNKINSLKKEINNFNIHEILLKDIVNNINELDKNELNEKVNWFNYFKKIFKDKLNELNSLEKYRNDLNNSYVYNNNLFNQLLDKINFSYYKLIKYYNNLSNDDINYIEYIINNINRTHISNEKYIDSKSRFKSIIRDYSLFKDYNNVSYNLFNSIKYEILLLNKIYNEVNRFLAGNINSNKFINDSNNILLCYNAINAARISNINYCNSKLIISNKNKIINELVDNICNKVLFDISNNNEIFNKYSNDKDVIYLLDIYDKVSNKNKGKIR